MNNNVKLITELGELILGKEESINITLNRIVDDLTEIDNRFQDFTYEFSIPRIKQNELVFDNAGALNKKNPFNPNTNINTKLYNNNILLLDGIINLIGINEEEYKCKLNSKFKEFIDDIGKKKLNTLNFPLITWEYEKSIIDHINSGYTNSDQTTHQFPLIFYSTYFCEYSVYKDFVDNRGFKFSADDAYQNFYYLITNKNTNRMYAHQLPPAIYLVSIIKQIFIDSGWGLGGQFFNDENIKKIIYLYAGDDDIYDQATGSVSGSTTTTLQLGKFLPDITQSEFIQSIINTFNLYIIVDTKNKIVSFETYNNLFSDNYNPYDITKLIDGKSVNYKYVENNDPSINFVKANNQLVNGDNKVLKNYGEYYYDNIWLNCNKDNYNKTYNKEGTTDTIKVGFSEPTTKEIVIYDIFGGYISIPNISKQTPTNNNSKKFNNATGDTYVMNNESTITYAGKGSLMYYYGIANSFSLGIPIAYSGVSYSTNIGIASPWQISNFHRNRIQTILTNVNESNKNSKNVITSTYLQRLWQYKIWESSAPINDETDYSLVFDDDDYLHETLYTKFHANKYNQLKHGVLLEGRMIMSPVDWQEMQMQRPIKYNGNIYRLISINYNPIKGLAEIQLISKT